MLVTVTNTSGGTLNALDSYADATGGARKDPLPYPFGHIGSLANAASKQLPMHPKDLFHNPSAGHLDTLLPSEQFNQLVKANKITFAVADQAGVTATDELFMIEVG